MFLPSWKVQVWNATCFFTDFNISRLIRHLVSELNSHILFQRQIDFYLKLRYKHNARESFNWKKLNLFHLRKCCKTENCETFLGHFGVRVSVRTEALGVTLRFQNLCVIPFTNTLHTEQRVGFPPNCYMKYTRRKKMDISSSYSILICRKISHIAHSVYSFIVFHLPVKIATQYELNF